MARLYKENNINRQTNQGLNTGHMNTIWKNTSNRKDNKSTSVLAKKHME